MSARGTKNGVAGVRHGLVAACLVLGAGRWLPGANVADAVLFAQQAQRPGRMPALPLTELDDHALGADLDNRTFSLTFAQPIPLADLLMLLVRGTTLSIVPDPAIAGTFVGELNNVTIRQALDLVLPARGLGYTVDGRFIRVAREQADTRLFDINYIGASRTATSRIGGDGRDGDSFASVTTTAASDLFEDLGRGVQTLLSEHGKFNVDRKAGLLQVTDVPERLDRVAVYLEAVQDRIHRQVEIDARVIEVELKDEHARSIEWPAVAQMMAGGAAAGGRPARAGFRVTDVPAFMSALAAQGDVSMLANPRLLAMNNEPAIVRASLSAPAKGSSGVGAPGGSFTISVTPQIAPGGIVMLSLSPILTLQSPASGGKSDIATRESDTLARVADGDTIVIAGFGRDRETRTREAAGIKGGWFGRKTVVTRKHVELLILLTPKVVTAVSAQ